jgi:hypothetical protein
MSQFVDTVVPEGARPAVKAMLKHHFWILAVLLPLILLPLLFSGSGAIGTQIDSRRQEIDGKLSQVKQVSGVNPHPNEEWSKAIETQALSVSQEIEQEWDRLWESQAALRVWPQDLGADFLRAISRMRTNDSLPRPLLQRYQTTVPRVVTKLPERMGVPAAPFDVGGAGAGVAGSPMADPRMGFGAGGTPGGVPIPGSDPAAATPFMPSKFTWNPGDQARIFQSFVWTAVPSTRQVLMAQEQLWVYGLFCDIFREFVKDATGPHDSPVAMVDEIAIGQDAAEPGPGGMLEGRVFLPAAPRGAAGMGMDMSGMGSGMGPGMGSGMDSAMMGAASGFGGGQRAGRGMRLRGGRPGTDASGSGFPGGPGGMPGTGAGGAGNAAPNDTELLSFAYVDFGGSPLPADKLATEPGAEMVHLMPFALRVVIDQRKIDAFLVALAASPIPIDVRQIRINADGATTMLSGAGGMPGMMPMGSGDPNAFAGGGGFPAAAGLRRHDVRLEVRGTVAVATKRGDPVVVAPPTAGFSRHGFGRSVARLRAMRGRRPVLSVHRGVENLS